MGFVRQPRHVFKSASFLLAIFSLLLAGGEGAQFSRARIVTPFGCSMSGLPKLQKAVESTELNSFSNVQVLSDADAEEAKVFFFSGDKQVRPFLLLGVGVTDVRVAGAALFLKGEIDFNR